MASKQRRRRLLPVALLLAAAALGLGFRPVSQWRNEQRAAAAFAALGSCLFGSPLPEPTAAERRLRAVTVAVSLDPRQASWPSRCEPYARSLRSASALECEGARCRLLEAIRLEAARAQSFAGDGESSLFDPQQLLEAAAALGWRAEPDADAPPAPRPAPLLDPAALRPLFEGNYLRLLTDPAGDETIELMFYEHESRYGLCEVSLGGRGDGRCRQLSEQIPVGMAGELLAAERGAPASMFAQGPEGDGWGQALYDVASGRRLTALAHRPAGGFVWKDGSLAHVSMAAPMADLALYRIRGGEADPPAPLALDGEPTAGPRLVWDEVVWSVSVPGEPQRHRVFAQRALPGRELLGPRVELGDTGPIGPRPQLDICRTPDALMLLVGATAQRAGMRGMLAFRTAAGWQPPIAVTTSSARFGFTCQGQTATLSWIRGDREVEDAEGFGDDDAAGAKPITGRYLVHRLRCDPSGCRHDKVAVPLRRFSRESRYVAGDLGTATLLLWRSAIGDVRMRVAPLEDLPVAPDVPLFDDLEHDGFGWDLERDPIFGRGDSVLLLVSRQIGTTERSATYGLRIDAGGTVTPIAVTDDRM